MLPWSDASLVRCYPVRMQSWSDASLVKCNPARMQSWSVASLNRRYPGRMQVWLDAILVGCNPGWIQSISKKTNIRAPTCLIQVFGSALRGTLLKEWKSQILLWQHTGSRKLWIALFPADCTLQIVKLNTWVLRTSTRCQLYRADVLEFITQRSTWTRAASPRRSRRTWTARRTVWW